MSRHLLQGLVALSFLLCAARPHAAADPRPQTDAPFVGLALFASNGSVSHTCSGVMLAPRVFLTSGGCTAGMDMALVWSEVTGEFDPSNAITGQPVTHPAFDDFAGYPNSSDLGVVLLEEPIDLPVYAQLPAIGTFDAPGATAGPLTSVTFALEVVVPFMQPRYIRLASQAHAVELGNPPSDGYNLNVVPASARMRLDDSCVGARGRPLFLAATGVVAGIASVVSTSGCGGSAFYFRLDTPFAHDFLRTYLQ